MSYCLSAPRNRLLQMISWKISERYLSSLYKYVRMIIIAENYLENFNGHFLMGYLMMYFKIYYTCQKHQSARLIILVKMKFLIWKYCLARNWLIIFEAHFGVQQRKFQISVTLLPCSASDNPFFRIVFPIKRLK